MKIMLEKDFEKLKTHITPHDLNAYMSLGFVVRCRYGSLVALRAELTEMFRDDFKYPTLSSNPLYVVHWNDLCEAKQRALEKR